MGHTPSGALGLSSPGGAAAAAARRRLADAVRDGVLEQEPGEIAGRDDAAPGKAAPEAVDREMVAVHPARLGRHAALEPERPPAGDEGDSGAAGLQQALEAGGLKDVVLKGELDPAASRKGDAAVPVLDETKVLLVAVEAQARLPAQPPRDELRGAVG
jgi:hypothetical protein